MLHSQNHKGFINIIALGVVAILGLAGSVYVADRLNEYEKAQEEQKLGATILTTALTDTIGTFRTNVNTSLTALNAQLTDSTSTDPGHIHTTSSVQGSGSTTPISRGGTGTTTAPTDNKLLIGSSTSYAFTNAIPDCSTASSSKLLFTSSTRSWSCGLDTASIATSTIAGQFLRSTSTSPYTYWGGLTSSMKSSTTDSAVQGVFATTTIPAGMMTTPGGIRIKAALQSNNGGDAYSFQVAYGTTTIASSSVTANTRTYAEVELMNYSNDANKQTSTWILQDGTNVNTIADSLSSFVPGYFQTNSAVAQTLTISLIGTINNKARIFWWTVEAL